MVCRQCVIGFFLAFSSWAGAEGVPTVLCGVLLEISEDGVVQTVNGFTPSKGTNTKDNMIVVEPKKPSGAFLEGVVLGAELKPEEEDGRVTSYELTISLQHENYRATREDRYSLAYARIPYIDTEQKLKLTWGNKVAIGQCHFLWDERPKTKSE